MNKIKVTIIYPSDPLGFKAGGIDTFIKGFIKYSPDQFSVDYVGITFDKDKRPPKQWLDVNLNGRKFRFYALFCEKMPDKKKTIPLSLRFILALYFSRLRFNRSILFFNRIEVALFYKKLGYPKIAVVHNDISQQFLRGKSETYWSKLPKFYHKLEKYLFEDFNEVLTVNQNTYEYYKNHYQELKTTFSFIPTWVDNNIFYPSVLDKRVLKKQCRNDEQYLSDKKWLLFVGRLQDQKAPLRIIDTFRNYHKRNSESHIFIIGEGNLRQKIIDQINGYGLSKNVSLLGSMSQEQLIRYYQAADVFLLTSNFEGMPISVLEALGCGLPVVTTDVGEVKRVVKNGYSGEIVQSFDPESLANQVETVINYPERYLQKNCLAVVAEFVPRKVLQQLYQTFTRLYLKEESNNNQQ